MKTLIGEILPLAIVVTVSPINIVAAILLLFSKRPIVNATSYLIGFLLGVAAVLTGATVVADAVGLAPGSDRSRAASLVLLALGIFLIIVALRKLGRRPDPDEASDGPKWMQGIADFGAAKGVAVGLLVGALNPKNIVVALAAAVSIATSQLPAAQQVAVIATYVVVASLGVAAPIVTAVALGDRAATVLTAWKDWLDRNNGTVMAVIYLVFGVLLLGKGIGGL